MNLNYKDAGVDTNKEEESIAKLTEKIVNYGEYKNISPKGHYAGLLDLDGILLAMTTDGVGTKLLVASKMDDYIGLGIDCIAMNVNDVVCVGAKPIAFVDYLSFEKPSMKIASEIGKGLNMGAKKSNLTVLGGETATMPEVINNFDIAGTCVGIVEKGKPIISEDVSPGEYIVGMRSSGIHSNGVTLARKSIESSKYTFYDNLRNGMAIGDELLKPTRIYSDVVLDMIEKHEVTGLAHITGGGLKNLKRLGNHKYDIKNPMDPQEIFKFIKDCGNISEKEMYRVFNMGTGFCIITPDPINVINTSDKHGIDAKVIGRVKEGDGVYINGVGKI